MEKFEIIARYPNRIRPDGYNDRVFNEKVLMRYKNSEIKAPVVLPPAIFDEIERIENFNVLEDDIFLCGFMRSGTTFMQEMLWIIGHDFDFEKANEIDIYDRAQFFEFFTSYRLDKSQPFNYFETLARPRVFKTHLPIQLLPPQIWTKNPKMIILSRDVKDVAVSTFHLRKNLSHENVENIEEHFEDFMNNQWWYAPYREHFRNYQTLKDKPNILFLTYEEVVGDWESAISKVAKFLEKNASNENVKKLAMHLDFKSMKKNPIMNMESLLKIKNQESGHNEPTDTFIRKGVAGGYKDEMSLEYTKKLDEWFRENLEDY